MRTISQKWTRLMAGSLICLMFTGNTCYSVWAEEESITVAEENNNVQTMEESQGAAQDFTSAAAAETTQPTENPETTQMPQPTENPEITQTPQITEEPQPTQTPGTTENPLPTQVPSPTNVPDDTAGGIRISRSKLNSGIKAESDFSIEVLIQNTWKKETVRKAQMVLDLPQEISMDKSYEKATIDIPDIKPGETKKVKVKLHAGKIGTDVTILKIKTSINFCHGTDGTALPEAKETLLIPVAQSESNGAFVDNVSNYSESGGGSGSDSTEKKKVDPTVPRIIVSQYDYDKDAEAGKEFTATLTICNTNEKTAVENMILSYDAGETATLEGSSNTAYIKSLKPQETYSTEIKLKVPQDSKTNSADVNVSFKYEYMKNQERTEVESSSKVSIPVKSPDRFGLGNIQTTDEPTAGEEFTASLSYVNKGSTEIRNLEATMETGMKTEETYKYVGNIAAGTSGSLDFFVTAENEGTEKVKITVTYEDSAGEQKTLTKETDFEIQKAEETNTSSGDETLEDTDEMYLDDSMGSGGGNIAGYVGIGAGGAGGILLIQMLLKGRKKKHIMKDEEF